MNHSHLNLDIMEMKNMIMCFRRHELAVLLGFAGLSKSGLKNDLMTRALQLLKSSACNNRILAKIVELYGERYPGYAQDVRKQYAFLFDQESNQALPKPAIPPQRNDYPLQRREDVPEFNPLTFFEHISEILPATRIMPKSSRQMQDSSLKFCVTQQQALKVKSGITRDSKDALKYGVQIQLRFCVWNTTTPQDDMLPLNLTVKVDRSTVPLPPFVISSKMAMEPKRMNLPLNITPFCRLSNRDDVLLEIKWSKESSKFSTKGYAVTINLVQHLNVDDLVRKLEQRGNAPSSLSRDLVKRKLAKDPESDVSLTSLRVSLICPLGKMRMKIPVRPLTCNHLQCFDANLFLMLNIKKPTWVCPVCDKSAKFSDLRIDGLFSGILTEANCDEIEFGEDGSWHHARKKMKTVVIGTPTKVVDLSKYNDKPVDKKKKVDVIDLTCDSSDDERTPVRIPDGTTMQIDSAPISISPDVVSPKLESPANDSSSIGRSSPCRATSGPHSSPASDFPASVSSSVRRDSPYKAPTRASPARSPNQHPSSFYHRSWQSNEEPSQLKTYDLTRRTPPLRQSSITSHFTRQASRSSAEDNPPSTRIPTPPRNTTPFSSTVPALPSLSNLDPDPYPPRYGVTDDPPSTNYPSDDYPFFPMPRNGVRSMIPPHFQPPSLPPVFSDHLRGALSPSETDSMLSSRTDNLMFKPGSNNSAPSYF